MFPADGDQNVMNDVDMDTVVSIPLPKENSFITRFQYHRLCVCVGRWGGGGGGRGPFFIGDLSSKFSGPKILIRFSFFLSFTSLFSQNFLILFRASSHQIVHKKN